VIDVAENFYRSYDEGMYTARGVGDFLNTEILSMASKSSKSEGRNAYLRNRIEELQKLKNYAEDRERIAYQKLGVDSEPNPLSAL
jgi:hypothetical protein